MPLAIDFGTCNTVVATWREGRQQADVIRVDGLSRRFAHQVPGADGGEREAHVIPSLIHYGERDSLLLGQQVNEAGLADHTATFRWLKLEMLRASTRTRRVNGKLVPLRQAAADLLRNVLAFAAGQAGQSERDLVLTVPVEAYDHYIEWMQEVAAAVFPGTVRFLDEATACILGYQHRVRDGETYLVFDFGGGTLDVSVVKVALEAGKGGRPKPTILGRAGEELGGGLIDQWMLEHLRSKGTVDDSDIAAVGARLVWALEEAKIALSCGAREADISQFNDRTGRFISHTMTRQDLAALLKEKDLPQLVAGTIHRALEMAQERYGLLPSHLRGVLMVGGSSMLLGVADIVRTSLPTAEVHCDRPFEAIAAGACRYAGEDLNPTLVHEYGIYGWNRETKDYDWIPVIPRGTRYPTDKPVSGRYISTAVAESDVLGLVVSERSWMKMPQSDYEVGSDGQLRVVAKGEKNVSGERELNPQAKEFIRAAPPCGVDEPKRFVVAFGVDRHKRLTVSIKDTRQGNNSYVLTPAGEKVPLPVRDFPLVKL